MSGRVYNLNDQFTIGELTFQPCYDPATNSKAVRVIGAGPIDPMSPSKAYSLLASRIGPEDRIVNNLVKLQSNEASQKVQEEEKKKPSVGDVILDSKLF